MLSYPSARSDVVTAGRSRLVAPSAPAAPGNHHRSRPAVMDLLPVPAIAEAAVIGFRRAGSEPLTQLTCSPRPAEAPTNASS